LIGRGFMVGAVSVATVLVIYIGELTTPRDVSLASLALVPMAVTAWFAGAAYRPLLALLISMSFLSAYAGSISYQSAAAVSMAAIALTVVVRLVRRSPASQHPAVEAVPSPTSTTVPAMLALPVPEGVERTSLTPRERQVVQLAAAGLTAREIGARLFIGDRTVETHLANSYAKLGVGSKRELMRRLSKHVS
jgi:DNA-binding CsgD family transcriptional regulator